jgi:hypothetical protein
MKTIHDVDIPPRYFEGITRGYMSFYLGKDDGIIQPGHMVRLREMSGNDHTGRELHADVLSVLSGVPELAEGYCALALLPFVCHGVGGESKAI